MLQEKYLILKTKKYWEDAIYSRFLSGETAYANFPSPRWSNGELMKIHGTYCLLCNEYLFKDFNCLRCPFVTILKKLCIKSGGKSFCLNPCAETCRNFINNFNLMLEGIE